MTASSVPEANVSWGHPQWPSAVLTASDSLLVGCLGSGCNVISHTQTCELKSDIYFHMLWGTTLRIIFEKLGVLEAIFKLYKILEHVHDLSELDYNTCEIFISICKAF